MKEIIMYARRVAVDDAGKSILGLVYVDEDELLIAIQKATANAIIDVIDIENIEIRKTVDIVVRLRRGDIGYAQ